MVSLSFISPFARLQNFRARNSVIAKVFYGLLNYSRTLQVLNQLRNTINNRQSLAQQREIASQAAGSELGIEESVYFEPRNCFVGRCLACNRSGVTTDANRGEQKRSQVSHRNPKQ